MWIVDWGDESKSLEEKCKNGGEYYVLKVSPHFDGWEYWSNKSIECGMWIQLLNL